MVRGVLKASFATRFGRLVKKTVSAGVKGFVIAYCISKFGIEVTMCMGPSMEPTIQDGDVIVIEKITILNRSFKRGDIVVCRDPSDPHLFLCKRLVGMPGDVLTSPDIGCLTVPRGSVWLQGDNYTNSADSRNFGAVPMGLLKGRAFFKLNTWGPLE